MMLNSSRPVRAIQLIGVIMASVITSIAISLNAGETRFNSCVAAFRQIAKFDALQQKLEAAGLADVKIIKGSLYISKNHVCVFAPDGELLLFHKDDPNLNLAIQNYLKSVAKTGDPIVVSGNILLSKQIKAIKELLPPDSAKNAYYSPYPNLDKVNAKKKLLAKKYSKVQFIVDMNLSTNQLYDLHRAIALGEINIRGSKNVEIIALKDMDGPEELSQKFRELHLPSDVVRIVLCHQSNGVFEFSDKSFFPIKELTERRLNEEGMEIICACNLQYDENSWLMIDRILYSKEIMKSVEKIDKVFSNENSASGKQLVDAIADDNGLIKVLDVVPFVIAGLAAEQETDDQKEEEEEKKNEKLSKMMIGISNSSAFTQRIKGETLWFGNVTKLDEIKKTIWPSLQYRPVLFWSSKESRLMFFLPPPERESIFPEPLVNISVDGGPSAEQIEKLQKFTGLFWFLITDSEMDALEARGKLLEWQERHGLKLPFIMLSEPAIPTRRSWTMLQPFFLNVNHWAESMPTSAEEAWKCGLFWCTNHDTAKRLDAYGGIVKQQSKQAPFPLGKSVQEANSYLATHLSDPMSNAFLIGVWAHDRLRTSNGDVMNGDWSSNKTCASRFTFVSAYPIRAPIEGIFYETDKENTIPKCINQLFNLAKDGKTFNEVKNDLINIYLDIQKVGGSLSISSCGQYLLISE